MGSSPRVLSLCAGIGGLGEGARLGAARVGVDLVTRLHVEIEPFGAAVLATQIAEARLAPAAVFSGDLRELPTAALLGRVDMVCAGFPCQDISFAGKGAGIEGERSGLWLDVLDVAVQVGARYHHQRVVSPCPPFLKGVHSQPDSRESRWWGNVCPSTTLYGILQRHLGTICEQATLRGNHQGPPPTQEA